MRSLPYLIVGVITTLVGVWILVKAVREMRLAARTRTWPTVPGCVTHAEVVSDDGSEVFEVEYRFEVAGVRHRGDVLQFGHPQKSSAIDQELVDRYAVGT